MSTKKSNSANVTLVPAIGLAIGMLTGAVIGTAVGAMLGNELAVVWLYVGGAIVGAISGSILGFRWQTRRQRRRSKIAGKSEKPCAFCDEHPPVSRLRYFEFISCKPLPFVQPSNDVLVPHDELDLSYPTKAFVCESCKRSMLLRASSKHLVVAITSLLIAGAVVWWLIAGEAGFVFRTAGILLGIAVLVFGIRALCLCLTTTDSDWQTEFLVKELESRFRQFNWEFNGSACWTNDGVKRSGPQYFDCREWHGVFHLPIGEVKYQTVPQAWAGKERGDAEANRRKLDRALAEHERGKKRQR